ncbi:MAG: exopolysaccharide biosynthesis polyprenyl glycosylphosphotransferase [Bacteroidota bacterium]
MRNQFYLLKVFALITEFFLVYQSCRFAYFLRYNSFESVEGFYFSFFLIFGLGWMGISLMANSYDSSKFEDMQTMLWNFLTTAMLHVFLILFFIVSAKAQYLSRYYLILTYSSTLLTALTFRSLLFIGYKVFESVTYITRKIVMVGPDPIMHELGEFLDENQTGVVHLLSDMNPELDENEKQQAIETAVKDLKVLQEKNQISELYFSMSLADEQLIDELSDFTDDHFIYFRMISDFNPLKRRNFELDFIGPYPTLTIRQEPLKFLGNVMIKRAFDIIFSLLVIVLLFPILIPIVSIAIMLDSKGPVFLKQLRTGRNAENFHIYKFRTMYVESESDSQAKKDDDRITRVGKFLRKTSLDEIPQFLNVLLGNMSVVGPRPHMVSHTDEYSRRINKYLLRHFVLPGITGHAQVNGFRGGTEDPEMMVQRVKHDAWYIENWSLWLDIKIILHTIWLMFKGQENAY